MSFLKRLQNSPLSRFAGRAGIIVICRVTGALLTLAYTFLLAKVAPAGEVGTAFAALSLALLLSVVASLNVETGSIRYLPLYLEKNRRADAAGFVKYCRYVVLGMCGIGVILGIPYVWFWDDGSLHRAFLVALIVAPVAANTRINSKHATALGLVLQGTLPRILIRPLLFTVVLLVCNGADIKLTATEIMVVFLATTVLTSILQWRLMRHAMEFCRDTTAQFSERRDWTTLGLMLIPMLLMAEYMRNIVILSSSLVIPDAAVAQLGISLSLVGVLSFGVTAIDMTLSPLIARALVNDNRRRASRLLMFCGIAKLGGLAVGIPLFYVLVPHAVALLGPEYAGIEKGFLILVMIPFSNALFGPANVVLNVLGLRRALFWSTLTGGLVLLAATLLGGMLYGLTGVMLGAAGAMFAYSAMQSVISHRYASINTTFLSHFIYLRQESRTEQR